jgi:hypothetical protein
MLFGGKWAYQYGSCRQIFKGGFELMVYALDRPFKKVWKIANFVCSFYDQGRASPSFNNVEIQWHHRL